VTGRQKFFIGAALVALCVGAALAYMLARTPREPSFGGKTLSEWLAPTFHWKHGAYAEETPAGLDEAMQAMGTNAIPHLLRMIHGGDSAWTSYYLRKRYGPFGTWFSSGRNDWFLRFTGQNVPFVERRRAVAGFKALHLIATNALPELLAFLFSPLVPARALKQFAIWVRKFSICLCRMRRAPTAPGAFGPCSLFPGRNSTLGAKIPLQSGRNF
jgi:hypothetical protein